MNAVHSALDIFFRSVRTPITLSFGWSGVMRRAHRKTDHQVCRCKMVRDEPSAYMTFGLDPFRLALLDLPWGVIRHYIYLAVERITKIIRAFGCIKVKQQVAEFAEAATLAGNAHTELAAIFIFIV